MLLRVTGIENPSVLYSGRNLKPSLCMYKNVRNSVYSPVPEIVEAGIPALKV
jgi:hypothetical protein